MTHTGFFASAATIALLAPLGSAQSHVAGSKPGNPSQGLSSLETPGHTAADTLFKLRHPEAPGPLAVTINTTPSWPVPPGATGFDITLSPAETGVVWNGTPFQETFGLLLPAGYNPSTPPPLVVAWHGYGTSQNQIFFSTNLPTEANSRGWMLMAPLGIADNTFSWLPGQQAVEKSLAWLAANHPFDDRRVYGVGFSMGAQCITNYAARHQDPSATRFAAVATVCGAYDVAEAYINDVNLVTLLTVIFGGDPNTAPFDFEYERVSLLRMAQPHPAPLLPIEGHTMARALSHIPYYMAYSTDDFVVPYVPDQNHALYNYFVSLGANPVLQTVSGKANPHDWSVLNTPACFNFFATKVLPSHPASFTILADRMAVFNDVTIAGGAAGSFSRFDFTSNVPLTSIDIASSTNVGTYTINGSLLGYRSTNDFTVTTADTDASGDAVVVKGSWPTPSKVRIDGVDDYGWSYDSIGGATTIHAPAGSHATSVLHSTFDALLGLTGPPAIGTSVTFDLTGGADGESFVIAYAAAIPGTFPLILFGDGDPRSLLLDINTIDGVTNGTLSGGGQAHPVIPIPNNPVFVGLSIKSQALTAPGVFAGIPFLIGRISNPITITFE